MGAPALTSRGLDEADFRQIVEYFDRAVGISLRLKESMGPKLKDFRAGLASGADADAELAKLRDDVASFSQGFPTVGFDEDTMVYPEKIAA